MSIDNNQKALSHFGTPGMRWGVRRAEKAAIKSSRAKATAKDVESKTNAAASQFEKKASESSRLAKKYANEGKIARSVLAEKYAESNKKKAESLREQGKEYTNYYNKMSEAKKMKANKLAAKYGDAETKKKIDSLIRKKSSVPYDTTLDLDTTDPVVASIKSMFAKGSSSSNNYD